MSEMSEGTMGGGGGGGGIYPTVDGVYSKKGGGYNRYILSSWAEKQPLRDIFHI